MQQHGQSFSQFPLSCGSWEHCRRPGCTLSYVTTGCSEWQPKSAFQGWSNAEGESVARVHKGGGASGWWWLTLAHGPGLSAVYSLWLSTGHWWQNTVWSAPVSSLGREIEQCQCQQQASLWGGSTLWVPIKQLWVGKSLGVTIPLCRCTSIPTDLCSSQHKDHPWEISMQK